MADSVRVLGRTLSRAKQVLGETELGQEVSVIAFVVPVVSPARSGKPCDEEANRPN